MDFHFPFMIKTFLHDGRESCSVDVLVLTAHDDRIHPKVVNDGQYLSIGLAVPEFFPEEEQVMIALGAGTNVNQAQCTSHSKVVQEVCKVYNDVNKEILGNPQMIKLPFQCQDSIAGWEVQLFHGDAAVSAGCGDQQYYSLLKVDLLSTKRTTLRRCTGTMCVIGSPNLQDHQAVAAAAAAAAQQNQNQQQNQQGIP